MSISFSWAAKKLEIGIISTKSQLTKCRFCSFLLFYNIFDNVWFIFMQEYYLVPWLQQVIWPVLKQKAKTNIKRKRFNIQCIWFLIHQLVSLNVTFKVCYSSINIYIYFLCTCTWMDKYQREITLKVLASFFWWGYSYLKEIILRVAQGREWP